MNLSDLKLKSPQEIIEMAESMGLEDISRKRKQDLIFAITKEMMKNGEEISGEGTLELLPDGYGFLRSEINSYQASPDDIYVSPNLISTINYDETSVSKHKILFENLTPLHADNQLKLEIGNGSSEDITARMIDLISPIGKGQRGLIVSPPKAGKTVMLQNIASSITHNHPECYLMVLLIDERPEEVTEMQRSVRGEVISSTFDEPPTRHVQVAEMAIEKAKRLVEHRKDVVILCDSITRLARAYNTITPASGRILTGGVDANALQRPKRFFGAARNTEEAGSLTIIATALIDTGSKMDEVIYEEFKGTGNMEVHLNRRIAEKRIFPAIDINPSGTRREELMVDSDTLQKIWILRKILHPMDEIQASEFLLERLKATKTNEEFFQMMKNAK